MVDNNMNLQSPFSDLDPEIISQKLTTGLQEITDITFIKKRVHDKARGVLFWSSTLEDERRSVSELIKNAIESKDVEDTRAFKHAKNQHSRNIAKYQKQKIKENLSAIQSRWKTMKSLRFNQLFWFWFG